MDLNFPKYDLNIKKEADKTFIFDPIRKKYLVAGPEEIVRQHLIRFLISDRNYPSSKIMVEQSIKLFDLKKRIDLVIYNKDIEPILLVECKAPEIPINQKVLDQIGRYNIKMRVPYLLVTNGLNHFNYKIDFKHNSFVALSDIPHYEELISEKNENE